MTNNNYDNLFFLFGGVNIDFLFIDKYLDDLNINYIYYNLNIIKNYLKFITEYISNKSIILLLIELLVLNNQLNWHEKIYYNDFKHNYFRFFKNLLFLSFSFYIKRYFLHIYICNFR